MWKNKYVIGIGCIGCGIGQSIIRSCRLSHLPLRTIGFGNNPYAFGMYDCDTYQITPSFYEENYIAALIQTCIENKVDILIPSPDDELILYAQNQDHFTESGIKAIVSGNKLVQICRNKEWMGEYFGSFSNIFVKTYKIDELLNSEDNDPKIFPLLAKPRTGTESKGIRIIRSIEQIKDLPSNYILQEMALPTPGDLNYSRYIDSINKDTNLQASEISIQLVVGKSGNLIGRMASYNKLRNGSPIEILPFDSPVIWEAIDSIMPLLLESGLRGPLNIQGRITEQGFKIFEMNPRFTHMTGLRALMGFNEVDACIRSWLDLPNATLNNNFNRFGVSQTQYRAVEIKRNTEVQKNFLYINKISNRRKDNLLITGTIGFLGQHLLSLLEETNCKINVLTPNKEKARLLYRNKNINLINHHDFESGISSLGSIDTIIHLGFTKGHQDYLGIVESLKFSSDLFRNAVLNQVPAIINISSQSIYGRNNPVPWKEDDHLSPQTPSAQALFATELMLANLSSFENQVRGTSLRLPALSGGEFGNDPNELIYKLVKGVFNSTPVIFTGESQYFESLDVRDAARAIVLLLNIPAIEWKPIYNVGSSKCYSLTEIASEVLRISNEYVESYPFQIAGNKNYDKTVSGMDSSLFMEDVGWSPEYDLGNMIHSLFQRLIGNTSSKNTRKR
jgi:nucleoside-diphosphate-sugar epimerase